MAATVAATSASLAPVVTDLFFTFLPLFVVGVLFTDRVSADSQSRGGIDGAGADHDGTVRRPVARSESPKRGGAGGTLRGYVIPPGRYDRTIRRRRRVVWLVHATVQFFLAVTGRALAFGGLLVDGQVDVWVLQEGIAGRRGQGDRLRDRARRAAGQLPGRCRAEGRARGRRHANVFEARPRRCPTVLEADVDPAVRALRQVAGDA